MKIPDRWEGQSEQDEVGEYIGCGTDDEEERGVDTGSLDAFVPDELDRSALEGTD